MGSDMMVAMTYAPAMTESAGRLLLEFLGKVADEDVYVEDYTGRELWRALVTRRIQDLQFDHELVGECIEFNFDIDVNEDERQRAAILEATIRVVVERNREVTQIIAGKRPLIVTGGMSSGDWPTDAWGDIVLMDAAGVFKAPVTVHEIRRAIATVQEQEKAGATDG